MKAEINNENKAKFFAQYWGQDVWSDVGFAPGMGGCVVGNHVMDLVCGYLELKDIKDLTEEDAIEVALILKHTTSRESMIKWAKRVSVYLMQEEVPFQYDPVSINEIVDFIRSSGYLVPWMGLSCEELIEAGWVKYKE